MKILLVLCGVVLAVFVELLLTRITGLEGPILERIEVLVSRYDGLLIGLGTLFLVSALAILNTFLTNSAADRRDTFNRQVQATLQIAQFRQAWINTMHADLSTLYRHLLPDLEKATGAEDEIGRLVFAILVRLNRGNKHASKLFDLLNSIFVGRAKRDQKKVNDGLAEFPSVTNEFLKEEWEELKRELKEAQTASVKQNPLELPQ